MSNRFLSRDASAANEFQHPLQVGICEACAVVQLRNPAPPAELRSRYPWITYNEAEGHLDRTVEDLENLLRLSPGAVIGGVSFKDDSVLRRFRERGYRAWRIDLREDLGVEDPAAGLETIQEKLDPGAAARIADKRGACDLLIVRHILEHAFEPRVFAEALKRLLKPGGRIFLEVPDCERALSARDYTTVWEEHLVYFTEESFHRALALLGFAAVKTEVVPYFLENALLALVQPRASVPAAFTGEALKADNARFLSFQQGFSGKQRAVQGFLDEERRKGPIAVFGAGHLSCAYINLMAAKDRIDFVVDDSPPKQGLLMPGSRLPIRPSAALIGEKVRLCLSSLNPETEAKVLAKQEAFLRGGGSFQSIFPGSPRALPV